MVSGELAGEGLPTGFSRHGLPPQRAPLDTAYPLREHLNSVQGMVSGGYCERVKSPKIRGGVKILNVRGSRNLTLFYRDSIENAQFGGQSPSFRGTTFGASSPPPLAFGTF